jgi:DNA polymerase-1
MEKLLLVDGSNLLFQMFYGMPARILNHEGKAIQGTLGFVGALLKIVRMVQPTHVAVLFDGECENERKNIDADYKANRPDYSQVPEEETPFSQMLDVYAALDYLSIARAETTDCETDDWIAGYVRDYVGETDIVIVSQDSDFFQLITDHVNVLRYRGDKTVMCDAEYIREKLGIEPFQYAEYKSLTGDTSDNIRGVEKVGPKTAAALMNQFRDVEDLIARVPEIEKPSVRASVMNSTDRIRRNYALIALSGEADLPFAIEDLAYMYTGAITTQVLAGSGLR